MAEKFEAMAKPGIANTWIKDVHDVWFLTRRFQLDGPTLRRAIEATFARWQTPRPVWPDPLSDAFANDAAKQTQSAAGNHSGAGRNPPSSINHH